MNEWARITRYLSKAYILKKDDQNTHTQKKKTGGGVRISTKKRKIWGKLISKLNAVRNTFRDQEEFLEK